MITGHIKRGNWKFMSRQLALARKQLALAESGSRLLNPSAKIMKIISEAAYRTSIKIHVKISVKLVKQNILEILFPLQMKIQKRLPLKIGIDMETTRFLVGVILFSVITQS